LRVGFFSFSLPRFFVSAMHAIVVVLLAIIALLVTTAVPSATSLYSYPHFIVQSPTLSRRFYASFADVEGVYALDINNDTAGSVRVRRVVFADATQQIDMHGSGGMMFTHDADTDTLYLYVALAANTNAVVRFQLDETTLRLLGTPLTVLADVHAPEALCSDSAAPFTLNVSAQPRICVSSDVDTQVRCYRAVRSLSSSSSSELLESWYSGGHFDHAESSSETLHPAYVAFNSSSHDLWIDNAHADVYELLHYRIGALQLPPAVTRYLPDAVAANGVEVTHIVLATNNVSSPCALCVFASQQSTDAISGEVSIVSQFVRQVRADGSVVELAYTPAALQDAYYLALTWRFTALTSTQLTQLRLIGQLTLVFNRTAEVLALNIYPVPATPTATLAPSATVTVSPTRGATSSSSASVGSSTSPTASVLPTGTETIVDSEQNSATTTTTGVSSDGGGSDEEALPDTWPMWLFLLVTGACTCVLIAFGSLYWNSRKRRIRSSEASRWCMSFIHRFTASPSLRSRPYTPMNGGAAGGASSRTKQPYTFHTASSPAASGSSPFIPVSDRSGSGL
jgi:hypothetical protein